MAAVLDDTPTIRLADVARNRQAEGERAAPRRIRVLLNIGNDKICHGHIVRIANHRMVVSVPEQLTPDQECAVFFGLNLEGQLYSIIGHGQVLHCVPVDATHFQAELRFQASDKKSRIALEQLFESDRSAVIR